MKKAVRTLRTRVGRVHREVQRQLHVLPEAAQAKVQDRVLLLRIHPADQADALAAIACAGTAARQRYGTLTGQEYSSLCGK